MQKIFIMTLRVAAALLAVTLTAGCVFEKENPSATQDNYKYVLVQIGVNSDTMVQTKTEGNVIGNENGVSAEVALDTVIRNLRVYAYTLKSNEKVLCGYLYAENVNAAETVEDPLLMDIKIPFNQYTTEQSVYFMAVANTGGMKGLISEDNKSIYINELGRNSDGSLDIPDNFSFDSFSKIQYSVAQEDLTEANGMPMYYQAAQPLIINMNAESDPVSEPGHAGHNKLRVKANINLTRSLAKIEVYAAEAAAETASGQTTSVKITEVSLANIPTSGNLFNAPEENAELDYGTGDYTPVVTGDIAVTKKVNENSDADIKTSGNYTQVMNAYYLAENNKGATPGTYDFGATDYLKTTEKATLLKIGYSVNGGEPEYGFVKMPPIERNTWYKVLCRISAGGKMLLDLEVLEWDDAEGQRIDFQDNVSLTGFGWGGTEDTANAKLTFGSAAGQTATFKFTLETPKNGKWYATIAEGDIQNFAFVSDGAEVKTVSGNITGQEQSFTIKTLETLSLGDTKSVKIRFVALTENNSRSLTVKFGTHDYYTIEQRY